MTEHRGRVCSDEPFLDLHSAARAGPSERLDLRRIEQIRRTVHRTPEVIVKVTGGGRSVRAVAEHLAYIAHEGEVDLESDRGERLSAADQRELLRSWHLELSAGQYRSARGARWRDTRIKLVHNIALGMPAGTPADKVLAAAKVFAREHFGAKHRYVLALHTHQKNPHVHLVVKAESEGGRGRLHIDKAMLRAWREDFARYMRAERVPANATPRSVRGETRRAERDAAYRAKSRASSSHALRKMLDSIVKEASATGVFRDPDHAKLVVTRRAVIEGWLGVARTLDGQGEQKLAAEVRDFVRRLAPVRTDRERLAEQVLRYARSLRKERATERSSGSHERDQELTR